MDNKKILEVLDGLERDLVSDKYDRGYNDAIQDMRGQVEAAIAIEKTSKPANPRNPCADCKNGIGPRIADICDECDTDELWLPSLWEHTTSAPNGMINGGIMPCANKGNPINE